MTKPRVQALSEYVARVMDEKGLTPAQVSRMSGGEITGAYVRGLARGSSSNPSVSKLKALARGLDVDEDNLFRIARGFSPTDKDKSEEDRSRYFRVVKLISASLKSPILIKLLLEVGKLPGESQEEALKLLAFMNRKKRLSRRRSRVG
jgi:transcriptional regulator with XRE-family HTH domain